MGIPVLADIERWITEHGSATVLKEHLALLQAKLGTLKDEIAKLERDNADLRAKLSEATAQLATSSHASEFVEERGALFKRKPGGGFQTAVYCPHCRQSTSSFPPGEEFNCKCGWFSAFTERELPNVLQDLNAA